MRTFLKLLFLLTAVSVAGTVWTTGFGQETPKALFEERCSACHTLERILKKTDSPEGWAKTVKRMRRKSFGKISKADADAITEHLVATQSPK